MVKIKVPAPNDAILQSADLPELAKHIGFFVIVWSLVEESVRDLYRAIILQSEADSQVRRAIISQVTTREQIDTIRRVAHLRRPDTDWERDLHACLKEIDGSLTNTRNRYIHDPWIMDDDGLIEHHHRGRDETTVTGKDGQRRFTLREPKRRSIDEIRATLDLAYEAHLTLERLRLDYYVWLAANLPEDAWAEMRPNPQKSKEDSF